MFIIYESFGINRLGLAEDKRIEDSIIKYVTNLFELEKEIDDNISKVVGNLFKLKKENEEIKDRTDKRY